MDINMYFFYFTESQEDSTKLQSQMEIVKMEEERQKLENDQKLQTATKDLSFTIAELEARQAELIEKLKVCFWHVFSLFRFSLEDI